MKIHMTLKLAGLLVAASLAASGAAALASEDDIQADIDGADAGAVARAHGTTISELARETESGPGKGAIVSAAASAHGKATSEAAKSRGDDTDEDVDTDEGIDAEDGDTGEDGDTDEGTQATGKPADAGAQGAETAAAAKADGKAFGQATAEAAKSKSR